MTTSFRFKLALLLALVICIPCAFAQNSVPIGKGSAETFQTKESIQNLGGIAVSYDKSGNPYLPLPDGSQITTIWPAAICVNVVDKEPCKPECEPAIYSVARVMSDGKYLWAKSYLVRASKKYVTCDSRVFGFEIWTPVYEVVVGKDAYLIPDGKTFALATGANIYKNGALSPEATQYLLFDVTTGNALSQMPKNMRIIDAEWLRQVKQRSWDGLQKKHPDKKLTDNFDFKRTPKFFLATEKAIFATQNPKD